MRERIEDAVAKMFETYSETPELKDFREEIINNMLERVDDYVKKGAGESEALEKALGELGDITEIADSMGRQKRNEALGDYFFPKKPLSKKRAAGYTVASTILLFGLIAAFVFGYSRGTLGGVLMVFTPFALVSVCVFVYLGLTQDTAAHYPMQGRRSVLYTVAAGLLTMGAFLGGSVVFRGVTFSAIAEQGIIALKAERVLSTMRVSSSVLLALILPGIAMMCYLVLTQEKRLKPWVVEQQRHLSKRYNAENSERFGIVTVAIWMLAIALFILLGFYIGWHPAWVVFLFAIAVEMLALMMMVKK